MADTVAELVRAIEAYAEAKLWAWTRENANVDEVRRLDQARENLAQAIRAAVPPPADR